MALSLDYVTDLEDEVALEGLDGITLEALWLRLKHRPNFETNMALDDYSKEFLWSLLCRDEEIAMYELPQPRQELIIFNRYEHMDQELGIILEPEELPPDIYPFCPIDDTERGIRGSCTTYYERQDVTQQVLAMTLKQVKKIYGEKLVIVASQLLRSKSLCITSCIDKFYDLTINQYMILERIGRSRRMGEITQGKGSLASMGENAKTMFYHRKRLLKMNLITKQHHQQKGVKGHSHNGSLLHLTRFYVERRSKFIMMIQRAVVMLKNRPNYCAPYSVVKEEMGLPELSCRKLFKSTDFQRFIRNVNKPYRKVYPDASTSQWKCKGSNMERIVRIMELINPDIDPMEMFKGDEVVEEEEEDEGYPGILDQSEIKWREDLLNQAYKIVEDAGPEGVTQSDMAQRLGQTKLDSRTICRNLQRCNTVHSLMKDIGRQRVSRYVSNKFLKTGHLTQEFRKERQKMMDMIEQDRPEDVIRPATSRKMEVMKTMESSLLEGVEVNMELITSKKDDKANKEAAAAGGGGVSSSSSSYLPSSTKIDSTPSSSLGVNSSSSVKELNSDGFLSLVKEIKLSYSNQRRNSPHVTTRMMKRANMIIQAVRTERVIDDSFRLQKMIVEAETKEGYPVRMDKKSLNRLLDKLAKGGFLKNIIVKLKSKTKRKVKQVRYVVHPSITFDNPHLISTIEQLKVKFMVGVSDPKKEVEGDNSGKKDGRRVKKEDRDDGVPGEGDGMEEGGGEMNSSVRESMDQLKLMHNVQTNKSEENDDNFKKLVCVKGTLGPKFLRMCELHKLLFYIVYGYEGQEELCQEDAWVTIASTSPEINLQNEDITEYPQIYFPELCWKMFIPPLQKHRYSSEKGWAFVCDVLLRLPLCIFVRLVSLSYTSYELDSFLTHPLKKNLLVKNLPPHLRLSLLHGRRYVTYVIELINRLCYIGLLQYGQQVLKEKDQVFIYVNRHATLVDTTISSPGYHQISTDKEYMRKEYHFTYFQDVLQYWYALWSISMNTPLGGHNFSQGKKVTIQILDRKPQMLESLTPRNSWEAPLRDVGIIPGDGRGASGLDSAMFAHLKRNWSSSTGHGAASRPSAILSNLSVSGEKSSYEGGASYSKYLMNTTNPSLDTQSPKHRLAGLRNVKLYRIKLGPDGKELEVPVKLVTRHPRGKKRREEDSQSSPSDVRASRKRGRANPKSYQRELKQRKRSPKKPYYDEEDRAALRRMNKLRVDWTSAEDSFLLLCKVASCFLFPNVRSQMITFSLVRDLMHERFPEARNKTSRACQRRINYIMKNATTEDNVSIFLEEVRQDASIVEDFKHPRIPKNRDNIANVYTKIFRELMNRLVVKFASNDSRQCPDLPNTMQEFGERYQVVVASSSLRNKLHIKEVNCLTDIDFHVVNALIYSSLCSKFDRESYAYQLYLAYQQYPQTLLHAVLTRMRQDQMISYKKCYNRSSVALTCLPLSTSPFQLSVTYQYVFNFKYQYEIFGQAWHMLKQLQAKNNEILKKVSTAQASTSSPTSPDVTMESGTDGPPENGVPVVINNEGGYCATIVALMATKRLIFDIVIPEQIIMMDQQHSLLQDHHQSLLQRFSDHTELSGRDIQELEPPSFTQPLKKDQKTSHNARVTRSKSTEKDVSSSLSTTQDLNEEMKEQKELLKRKNEEEYSDHSAKKICKSPTKATRATKTTNPSQEEEQTRNESEETATSTTVNATTKPNQKKRQPRNECKKTTATTTTTTTNTKTTNPSQEEQTKNESEETTASPTTTTTTTTTTTSPDHRPTKRKTLEETDDSMEGKTTEESSALKENQSAVKEDKKVTFQEGEGGVQSDVTSADDDGTESQTRNIASASRLGLYMMRDHLTLADVDQINLQHAQEHMVVNACEIMCSLRPPPHLRDDYVNTMHEDIEAANDIIMPLSRGVLANALEYRKRVTLDVWNTLDDVVTNLEDQGESPGLVAMVKEVYGYISECKEIGASVRDLKDKYRDYPYSITAITALMEEVHLVIRVGAAVVRWVSVYHSKPWFIHTAKITKVNRQSVRIQGVYRMNLDKSDKTESDLTDTTSSSHDSQLLEGNVEEGAVLPSDSSGSQKAGTREAPSSSDTSQQIPDTDTEVPPTPSKEEAPVSTTPTTAITTRRSARISHNNATEGDDDKGGESGGKRHIHSFLVMRKRNYKRDEEVSTSMEKTIKHHRQKSDHEKLDVAMRPWVKLNGTLNRRVLDRFLGSVLSLVMERPGISGRDVVCRFSPALQPAHTHDLLETLVQLQCVQRIQLVSSHKPSLFSTVVDYFVGLAEVHDCDDEVLYEPTVDAILKLSMFIGDKKYSQDFLMGDRK